MLPFMLFAVAAVAAQPGGNTRGATLPACEVIDSNPATLFHLRIPYQPVTPLVDGNADQAGEHLRPLTGAQAAKSVLERQSGYARILARFSPCRNIRDRDYIPEKRNVVRRFFMQKQVSKILTLSLQVNPVGVRASRPLMTISRDSGKKGENWTTDVWNDALMLPFFRLEPHSSVKLDFTFRSTRDYQSSVASGSLDILKKATALIVPNSALITPQNIDRFNEASTFVDSSINGLLKVSIDEKLQIESLTLDAQTPVATIIIYGPGANDPYARPKWEEQALGKWTISAERFDGSLFASAQKQDPSAFVPAVASVLNFHVSEDKSVREALSGDSSVSAARDAVLIADPKTVGDLTRKLCRAVASSADSLGFSPLDVNWIVAAYLQDMAIPTKTQAEATTGCGFSTAVEAMENQ